MEREVPTYYPGDRIELEVEIVHRVNFRQVMAVFRATSGSPVVSIRSSDVSLQEPPRPDGTKRSVVHFESIARRNWLIPGLEFELSELVAETVGDRVGDSAHGSRVESDVSGLSERPRFRYEEEAGQLGASALSAELL